MSAAPPEREVAQSGPSELRRATHELIRAARLGATAFGRPDLAETLSLALERLDRTETLVAVIGDFKQGKSALINALLGVPAAPVDDDLATAVLTLFRYNVEPTVAISSRGGRTAKGDGFPDADYTAVVSESGNPENRLGIELVEVGVRAPFLEGGLMLVDTPGFGGLTPGYGATTLGYLRTVDAVLFVSDASSPLTRPELDSLARAVEVCPAVLMVLSKIDLYGEWRRIEELDRQEIAARELDVPIVAVSSALMDESRRTADDGLAAASGVPVLRDLVEVLVMNRARADAARRGLAEAGSAIEHLVASARDELSVLDDPRSAEARHRALEEAYSRLERLRGPGARWSQVLVDGFSDMSAEAEHRHRAAWREISRELEERLEKVDPAREWPALAAWLQERATAASDQLISDLVDGARRVERSIRELLEDEQAIQLPDAPGPAASVTQERFLVGKGIDAPTLKTHAITLLSGVKGGQSGFLTLSFVAAVAGVTLSSAATAGIGLVFGGKQVFDERKKRLQSRRQQARTVARQFLDDVQFTTGKQSRDLARDLQRQLREHFLQRFTALQRTCGESLAKMQEAAKQDAEGRARGVAKLRARLAQLEQLGAAVRSVEEQL